MKIPLFSMISANTEHPFDSTSFRKPMDVGEYFMLVFVLPGTIRLMK